MSSRTVRSLAFVAGVASLAACSSPASSPPAGSSSTAGPAEAEITAARIAAHVRMLAHDHFEGRAPATRGGELATAYLASQLALAGVEPAGDNGTYFQEVPIVEATVDRSFTLSVPGRTFKYLDDVVAFSGVEDPKVSVSGDVVFVGHGIVAPEQHWNDYAGADVKGKWVLIMVNDPPAPADEPALFGGKALTYYGRWTYKFEEAARQGAAGALLIHTDESATYPWQVVQSSWTGTQYSLPPAPGAPALGVKAWIANAAAIDLATRAGHSLDALRSSASKRGFTAVPLGIAATAALTQTSARKVSPNVIGMLKGTNAEQAVAITAHWDHFGVRAPQPGEAPDADRIHNGAYDNASGCAAVLTMAQALTRAGGAPGRSIYFVFTTAEESGLLGSEYFAAHPPLPIDRLVANLNVDGANYLGKTRDIVMLGSERSSLGTMFAALATSRGRVVGEDTHPERGYFFRSDHFPLAKAGVPALSLSEPKQFEGPDAAALLARQEAYNGKDYHQPSDEYQSGLGLQRSRRGHEAPLGARLAGGGGHDSAGLQRRRPVRAGAQAMSGASLVTLEDLAAAAERVRGTAVRTPVIARPWPAATAAHPFRIKCENLQPMGAFKVRGAFNMLAQLPADARARGVITYSSGNHGQGVAMAAQAMGVPAVIVMPTTAPSVKVEGVRSYGAEVIFAGTTSIDRQTRAEAEAAARGLTIIPPFDHPMIIAGQGTVGLELLEQVPDLGTVFVPMGGGGLIAGVSAAIKLTRPDVRVVGVEPVGAMKMRAARDAGHPVTLDQTASIGDGIMNMRAGDLTFAHVQQYVDDLVAVPDEAMAKAVGWLFRNARLVAEPSGAATTAAVMLGLGAPTGTVVAIVSGGNVQPDHFAKYITS